MGFSFWNICQIFTLNQFAQSWLIIVWYSIIGAVAILQRQISLTQNYKLYQIFSPYNDTTSKYILTHVFLII